VTNRFGNYKGLKINKDSHLIDLTSVPTDIDEHSFLLAQKYAIAFRDDMIVAHLKDLGVTSLLDIGCDFGSLINVASKNGIIARGVDVNDSAIELAKAAGLDVVQCSIEQIVVDDTFQAISIDKGRGLSGMSCLNILHGDWAKSDVRDDFLRLSLSNFDYVIITATREWFMKISNEFNLTYVQFIGPARRPVRKSASQLAQYGSTFFFKGKLHFFENYFWDILLGKWRFPNPIVNYLSLVIIMSTRVSSVSAATKF
jgi:hypothetical protein